MSSLFQPSREDGRSDRQIVIDLVETAQSGDLLTHEEILSALQEESDREFDRSHVYRAAGAASRWLIKNSKKALVPVRGKGYRVSFPDDFHSLTLVRRDRASTQLNRGVEVLEGAPYEEMSETVREAIAPLQVLMIGAYAQLHAHHRRLRRHDAAIEDLSKRLQKLEEEDEN